MQWPATTYIPGLSQLLDVDGQVMQTLHHLGPYATRLGTAKREHGPLPCVGIHFLKPDTLSEDMVATEETPGKGEHIGCNVPGKLVLPTDDRLFNHVSTCARIR